MAVKQRTTYKPPAGASTYTFRQLEELWIGAGGSRTSAAYAAAIALAESKGNPNAEGHNSNGTVDRGLWQINSVHGSLSTTDIAVNAKAAVQIWKEEKGFSPWVTFKTGAYEAYLTPKNLLSGIKGNEGVQGGIVATLGGDALNGGKIPSPAKLVEEGLKELPGASDLIPGLPSVLKWLTPFAVTAVLLIAGAVLVVYGIMVAVRPREGALSLPKVPVPVPV